MKLKHIEVNKLPKLITLSSDRTRTTARSPE